MAAPRGNKTGCVHYSVAFWIWCFSRCDVRFFLDFVAIRFWLVVHAGGTKHVTHVSVCDALREISAAHERSRLRPRAPPLGPATQCHVTTHCVAGPGSAKIARARERSWAKVSALEMSHEASAEQVQGAPRVAQSTSRLIKPSLLMLVAALVHRSRANSPVYPTSPQCP